MKILYIAPLFFFLSMSIQAGEVNSCNYHKAKGDCEVVRVITRCDVDKQKLRNRISFLEKRVLELEATLKVVQINKSSERISEKFIYIDRIVQQPVIRTIEKKDNSHFILGVYVAKDVTSINSAQNSNGSTTTTVNQSYLPGVKLQYMFDFGLVPEIGINTNLNPILGLGWKF